MVKEVSEASYRWPVTMLSALAIVAPFNLRLTAQSWTELALRLLVVVALVIVVVLTVWGLRLRRWRPDRVELIAFAWLAMIWLSALLSDDVVFGAAGAVRLSVAALLIPATRSVIRTEADAQRVLQALVIGASAGALLGLGVWLVGDDANVMEVFVGEVTRLGPFNRLTRPWSHANVAAMAMGASFGAAATIPHRIVRVGVLSTLTVAMVLTISRGVLAAAAVAVVVWIVLRRDRAETMVIAGLVALAALVFVSSAAWTTRVDQLGDEAFFDSTIEVPTSFTVDPDATRSAADDLVQVTVTNDSITHWPYQGEDRVLISARWFGPDDQIWTEDWWELPHDLAPEQSVTTGLTVDARLPVGSYQVRWDLIVPDTAYFGQFLGDDPIMNEGVIVSSAVGPNEFFRYGLVERSVGIGRVEGWRLAWTDFVSSPFVGVGPNQFGNQPATRLTNQQVRVGAHAHNIVLEPLATWGLLGTIPFLLLGVGATMRSVRVAWRTRGVVPTAVAVGLAAVVTHGIVDWPLVTISNVIPVGVLVGLAWSDALSSSAGSAASGSVATDSERLVQT